jgi:hypothetical protein
VCWGRIPGIRGWKLDRQMVHRAGVMTSRIRCCVGLARWSPPVSLLSAIAPTRDNTPWLLNLCLVTHLNFMCETSVYAPIQSARSNSAATVSAARLLANSLGARPTPWQNVDGTLYTVPEGACRRGWCKTNCHLQRYIITI